MRLLIRNNNILVYGIRSGSERFRRHKAFYEGREMGGGGSSDWCHGCVYHKEQEYIWLRGGDLNGF